MATNNFRLNGTTLSQFAETQADIYPVTLYQPIGPRQGLVSGATTLSDAQLRQARDTYLLVDTSNGGQYTLTVGTDDSPAAAKELQTTLGLVGNGDQCVLRFACGNADFITDILLHNSASSSPGTNVQVQLRGSTTAASNLILFNSGDGGAGKAIGNEAFVEVTAENVSEDSAVIVFNIVNPVVIATT
jgi:hypothetical protein